MAERLRKIADLALADGSYSSASSPTSLHSDSSRSMSDLASSQRPSPIRLSAYQKLHGRKAPSPAGRPSVVCPLVS